MPVAPQGRWARTRSERLVEVCCVQMGLVPTAWGVSSCGVCVHTRVRACVDGQGPGLPLESGRGGCCI